MAEHEPWHQNPVNLREVLDDQPGVIARCVDRDDADRIVHEHNLFPDLLEVVRLCCSTFGRTCEQAWDGIVAEEWEEKAKAVLAKVEG